MDPLAEVMQDRWAVFPEWFRGGEQERSVRAPHHVDVWFGEHAADNGDI